MNEELIEQSHVSREMFDALTETIEHQAKAINILADALNEIVIFNAREPDEEKDLFFGDIAVEALCHESVRRVLDK